MAISSKKSALASAFLIGALAFTGCGAADQAKDSVAAASESASQVSLDGIQTLVDDYTKALTDTTDLQNAVQSLESDKIDVITKLLDSIGDNTDNLKTVEDAVSNLSAEDKATLKEVLKDDANKLPQITDYSDMSDDQQLSLDFINLILAIGISQQNIEVTDDNNKVNVDELKPDGNTVNVPAKALADSSGESADGEQKFFSELPAIYVDGQWKINGKKYLENLEGLTLS